MYVTGYSVGDTTGKDYATIKYSTSGDELWVARYNGPGNDSDDANDIAIDEAGDVYVTGLSNGEGGGQSRDFATIKYSTNGEELWVERYNGPGDYQDWARAITIDDTKNVYVTGSSWGTDTMEDYATVKYSQQGPLSLYVEPDTTYYNKGDILGFTVTVSSNADSTVFFQGWTEGETPWGLLLSPLLGPVNVVLGAYQTITPHISQKIPNNTPYGGPYIYTALVGIYPDSVYAEDSFEFFVVPPGLHPKEQQYEDWEVIEGNVW